MIITTTAGRRCWALRGNSPRERREFWILIAGTHCRYNGADRFVRWWVTINITRVVCHGSFFSFYCVLLVFLKVMLRQQTTMWGAKKSLITPHFFYTAAKRYKIISEAVFNNVHYIHSFMVCKNCKFARKKFILINIFVFFLIFAFCVLFDNFTSLQDFQQTRDLNFDTIPVLNKWYDTLILQTKKKKTHKRRCFPFCKTICKQCRPIRSHRGGTDIYL